MPVLSPAEEPKEAFVYSPPDDELRTRFSLIFAREQPLEFRTSKLIFDKVLSGICLLIALPVLGGLYVANFIEGLLIPENKGPLVFSYWASTEGRKFRKHKLRLIKMKYIDQELAKQGSWHAYACEWTPESRTHLGRFIKAFYLDELPQLFDIFVGNMTFVGPRPLACHHCERDIAQGNVVRKLLRAGLLGPNQALKGTDRFGKPDAEYEYIQHYMTASPLTLLITDMSIIFRCIGVVFRARGL